MRCQSSIVLVCTLCGCLASAITISTTEIENQVSNNTDLTSQDQHPGIEEIGHFNLTQLSPEGTNKTLIETIPGPPHNATNGSPNPIFDVVCFNPDITLYPAELKDCIEAIRQIPQGSKGDKDLIWSTDADRGQHIPAHWESGTCRVDIQPIPMATGVVEDEFSPYYVVNAASQVAKPCIRNDKNKLGGSTLVGDKGVMMLIVRGQPKARSPAVS